jgi:hypothetical protein
MLEKACITVESAAKGGGVCPEVLFDVARQWFSLYQKVNTNTLLKFRLLVLFLINGHLYLHSTSPWTWIL